MSKYYNEGEYLNALQWVVDAGRPKDDRTGVGTLSFTGVSTRYDLSRGFPLLTTKRMFWKGIVAELLWMLSGSTNIKPLQDQGVNIWNEWADDNGDLGPVYGKQWRSWSWYGPNMEYFEVDQIADVIESIKTNPESRRHIVSAWNPSEVEDMALPPCHGIATQFVCEPLGLEERAAHAGPVARQLDRHGAPRYRLSCVMHQRSGDMFLGVPFNIASYSLLTHMIAAECNMVPGDFVHTIGDAHVYNNHVEQAREQLTRFLYEPPTLTLKNHGMDGFKVLNCSREDIHLEGYKSHPAIKAPVAV